MKTWFTSDTHFGHDSIRRLSDRPFDTLQAMDEALVARWNACVAVQDTVWHLGDFAHRNTTTVVDYRSRLNGTIHLVVGNHDHNLVREHSSLFASIQQMANVQIDGHTLVLCHYPLREWDRAWRGSWHLHGHVHGRFDDEPYGFSLDVGSDSHEFAPIDVQRIAALLAGRKSPFVHNGDRATDRAAAARERNQRRRAAEPGRREGTS